MRRLIPLLFVAAAHAEPVSQHNEPHAGIQAAIDRLNAAGCTQYNITRTGQYVLHSTTDQNAYNLVGNTITIRCTRTSPLMDIGYTWTHATKRTDGSAITGLRSYVLTVTKDGAVIATATTSGTEHAVTGLGPGEYQARIATVEDSRTGPQSDPITVVID